jgi:hypothetical protein
LCTELKLLSSCRRWSRCDPNQGTEHACTWIGTYLHCIKSCGLSCSSHEIFWYARTQVHDGLIDHCESSFWWLHEVFPLLAGCGEPGAAPLLSEARNSKNAYISRQCIEIVRIQFRLELNMNFYWQTNHAMTVTHDAVCSRCACTNERTIFITTIILLLTAALILLSPWSRYVLVLPPAKTNPRQIANQNVKLICCSDTHGLHASGGIKVPEGECFY